jgi:hypothetical protein
MNELKELFPPPRLSPHFAVKTAARADRRRPAPRWMAFYWAALLFFALLSVARTPMPDWIRMAAVPAGFALALGWSAVARFFAPFFR